MTPSLLVKQTALVVSIVLLVMLLLTKGHPSLFALGFILFLSTAFVAWSGNKRLAKNEEAKLTEAPELSSEDSSAEEVTSQNLPLIEDERLWSGDISCNKNAVLKRKITLFPPESATSQELKNIIQQIVEAETNDFLELAKIAGLKPSEDFTEADLSGVDLCSAILNRADLSRAILSNANLSGANLIAADLGDAILSDAILSDAILSRANLSNVNLSNANLSGADLSRADLSNAILSDAVLSRTDLSDAKVENARFGGLNEGIFEEMKLDLKRRGAIFFEG